MIVVIATNVWISALHFGPSTGRPAQVVELVLRYHRIATSTEIINEIRGTLIERFLWQPEVTDQTLEGYFAGAITVPLRGTIHVCRDPNDDMLLECALTAGADVIVSGDKDLLTLNPYQGIRILTPAEFLLSEVLRS